MGPLSRSGPRSTSSRRAGCWRAPATVDAADVFVFPLAPPQSTAIPRTELLDRLGTHLTRHVGPRRRVRRHPAVRARRPAAHGQLAGERAPRQPARHTAADRPRRRRGGAVDTYPQPPGPATEATERTLRGAVQVVQSALRSGDRAGVVALGDGRPRWLGADIGRRQFYRVLDTVLGAGDGFETTTGTLAPRAALPPGAIVVAFSTMLDTEFALALIDLRKRGHTVVAVDVLEGAPFAGTSRIRCSPGCGRCSGRSCTATWAPSGWTWCPGRRTSTLDQSMRLVPERRRPVRGRR